MMMVAETFPSVMGNAMNRLMRWGVMIVLSFGFPAAVGAAGPAEEEWNKVVDRAIDFLKKSQAADGTWSQSRSPGITGVVLTGALETGRVRPGDEIAGKALK